MSKIQKVAKNTGITIIGDLVFRVISLFILVYLARYLGTTGFGKYSFVFAYLVFFEVVFDLGLQKILVREMSRDVLITPKLIGNGIIIRLILTIFAAALSVIIITLMAFPADTTFYVYLATLTLIFSSFSYFYATIFQANLKMEYSVYPKLVFKIISGVLIFWIIFSQGTLTQIILALVFSEGIKTLVSYLFSRKFVKPQFDIDLGLWKYLLKESLPLALSEAIFLIYYRIDILMLSMIKGDFDVGIYSAAYKLSEPLSLIPYALTLSLFPVLAASFKSSKDTLIKGYTLGIRYLLIIILPITIGTTLLADKIIFLIYGDQFAGSTTALQILIWSLLFTSVNSIMATLLISIEKQKLNTISIALCAVINIILNFILIPAFSYNGASIATVVTNVVLFVSSYYFVSRHLQSLPLYRILIKPVVSGVLMGVFVMFFIDVNVFLLVPLAGIVYLVFLFVLKTFSKEDIDMMKRMIKKKSA